MIFFITLFRYFTIVLFFTLHFFSFSQGMQTRERAHCARSVFPFIKEKKKNWSKEETVLAIGVQRQNPLFQLFLYAELGNIMLHHKMILA